MAGARRGVKQPGIFSRDMRFPAVTALASLCIAGSALASPRKNWIPALERHAIHAALPAEMLEARGARKAEAIERDRAMASAASTPIPAWTSLGPTSGRGGGNNPAEADSGRVSTIVPDPVDLAT